jgi:tRNA pseudouridine55 synthase
LEEALEAFRGEIEQVPPQFSAIKRGGQKAYDLARRGEVMELAPRPVTIWQLMVLDWQPPFCVLEVACSAGTYIRSLAHDLGLALGCGAHLAGLRRAASGTLRVEDAVSLDELKSAFAAGDWAKYLRPPESGLGDWPQVRLTQPEAERIRRGQSIGLTPGAAEYGLAFTPTGQLFAVLQADVEAQAWRPHKVLLPNAP